MTPHAPNLATMLTASAIPSSRLRSLAVVAALLVVVATPSPVKAQNTAAPKPFQEMSESALSIRDSVVALARAQVGRRYVLGGTSPSGFDCSGLVKYVLAALKVDAPRTSQQQARFGAPVTRDTSRLRPGDLLVFGKRPGAVSHVGIYVGNGRYVHASSVAGRVVESPLDRPASSLVRMWLAARSVFASDDSAKGPRG